MKKVSYLFILLTITTIQVKSQVHNIQFPESEIHGAGIPMEHEINYIEGTRNLFDDFKPGTVYYKKKGKIFQVPLRLNLYNDEFEYIKNDVVYALRNIDRIDKVVMDNQVFIHIEPNSENNVSGYVIMRNAELPAVITKMKMGYYVKENSVFGYKPERFERDPDRHYIMKSELEITPITSVKKLIKLLDSHSSELKRYAKEEKISGRNPADMAKILDYYHILGQDL